MSKSRLDLLDRHLLTGRHLAAGMHFAAGASENPPLAGRLNLAPVKQLRGGAGPKGTAGFPPVLRGRPCSLVTSR